MPEDNGCVGGARPSRRPGRAAVRRGRLQHGISHLDADDLA